MDKLKQNEINEHSSANLINLFRQEAIDNKYNRIEGELLVAPQSSGIIATIGTIFVFVILMYALFSADSPLATKDLTSTKRQAENNNIIYASKAGTISEILISTGDAVAIGEAIALIDSSPDHVTKP